ncbi:MAG: N,N-dimethylformamidase beta subunit family domain-containing protein, partial [Acidimicrobiia bacterium]
MSVSLVALLTAGLVGTVAPAAEAAAPCDPLVNAIACENTLPGNPPSEWDISGAGDASLQGFATQFSVDQGQTVGFKVDTTASAFTIDVYRVGWYQGNGARRVATLPTPLAQDQPDCLSDPATGLVDCGNWSQSSAWAVPATAVSGMYFARLRRPDTGGASHVFFVVRDDDGGSKVVFQTNDTTWHAYNGFGGNSLYSGAPVGRAYKVSYNRPFDTGASWPHTFFWQDQYPMIRFMERNGYDMSYISGVDADAQGSELLEHDVFVSAGHDEYWSKQQRTNVEAARDAGVHLAFFSGNLLFWKTRWESSIDGSGTARRTLVSYKETHAGAKIDPNAQWTGTWRDPRFSPPADGGNPENLLTGTRFMVNGIRNDTITVPSADGKLRLWRNTSVATQAVGATASLASGSLGYEWDEVTDDGTRPPGLIRMSDTTVPINDGKYLLDYGSTYGNGTARHSLAMYRAQSGALVFSAGTIRWAYGLATENADNSGGVEDVRMQQATVNLFADMGAQPGTLQSGLTLASASTDGTRPTATITSPPSGSTVQTGTPVTISGTATDSGGLVGGVEVSFDGGATWRLASGRANWSYVWTPNQVGTTTIQVRAIDDSLNVQTPGVSITLTSSFVCPCSIFTAATVPPTPSVGEALPVELGVKFRSDVAGQVTGIRFYKGAGNTGTHVGNLWSASGALLASATFTGESASGWQQVNFSSPVSVAAGTTYIASYFAPAGVYSYTHDVFGGGGVDNAPLHALASGVDGTNGVFRYGASSGFPTASYRDANYWVDVVFTTGTPPADTTAPTVSATSPVAGATGVSRSVTPSATFSEAVQAGTVGFSLAAGGTPVAGTSAYNATTRTATFTQSAGLA